MFYCSRNKFRSGFRFHILNKLTVIDSENLKTIDISSFIWMRADINFGLLTFPYKPKSFFWGVNFFVALLSCEISLTILSSLLSESHESWEKLWPLEENNKWQGNSGQDLYYSASNKHVIIWDVSHSLLLVSLVKIKDYGQFTRFGLLTALSLMPKCFIKVITLKLVFKYIKLV